jgi:pyruvate formate lyase activating enzyme
MGKGLIFDIRRYSVHDGPGIRTTVFFKGCPLNCTWCHNPESISPHPQPIHRKLKLNGHETIRQDTIGQWMDGGEVMDILLKDTLFYEESMGGVTFSGGEPLSQPDFLIGLLQACREQGLHTAVDTSGYAPKEVFLEVAGKADLLLFDLKTMDPRDHLTYTGVDNALIAANLLSLPSDGPALYIRIPVIPGVNAGTDHMQAVATLLGKVRAPVVRVDLLPYHRLGRQKYESLGLAEPPVFGPDTTAQEMKALLQVFADSGFLVKQGG